MEYSEQLDTDGDNTEEYDEDDVYLDYGIETYNIVSDFNNISLQHFTKKNSPGKNQSQFVRFSKQNYYNKIPKNKRKNIKITKTDC